MKKLAEEKVAIPVTKPEEKPIPEEFHPIIPTSKVELTQNLLAAYLEEIKIHFRQAGKNFELAILDQPIQVREGGEVVLEVMGHMQEEIAGKMKPDLVSLIRQFTGADRVQISVEVKEEVDNGKPKLYTNTDKLNFLRGKHPALAEFQRKFGLEVDF